MSHFWKQHPALLYGISALIGFQFFFFQSFILIFLFAALLLSLAFSAKTFPRASLALFIFLSSWGYFSLSHQIPQIPLQGISGTAIIEISNLNATRNNFGQTWTYQGMLKNFLPNDPVDTTSTAKQLPYRITLTQRGDFTRPLADRSYIVQGILKPQLSGSYTLKVKNKDSWHPLPNTWSLAEVRFQAKQKLNHYIQEQFKNSHVVSFLIGNVTGDFNDRLMWSEFSRFGLQHIMGISGFHFTLLAALLSFFLRLFFTQKVSAFLIILLLSLYFLFLGWSSAVVRAWLTILIFFSGQILEKRTIALNSLGIALLISLLFDPFLALQLGFQFSFLCTAAILLFYPIFDEWLQLPFSKRKLSHLTEMDRLNQHGYIAITLFRQALALTLAVHLVALPIALFYFHKFPLLGLLYNFFFPFLTTLSLFLLLGGFLAAIIFPPLATLIHTINNAFTTGMLNLTYNVPTKLDYYVRVSSIPAEILLVYLALLFFLGIFITQRQQEKNEFSLLL